MGETELQGRIEAVSKFVLQLAAELEMNGLIDGPRFSERLRGRPRKEDQVEYIRIARRRLEDMVDALDAVRAERERRARPDDQS